MEEAVLPPSWMVFFWSPFHCFGTHDKSSKFLNFGDENPFRYPIFWYRAKTFSGIKFHIRRFFSGFNFFWFQFFLVSIPQNKYIIPGTGNVRYVTLCHKTPPPPPFLPNFFDGSPTGGGALGAKSCQGRYFFRKKHGSFWFVLFCLQLRAMIRRPF